MAYANSADPDQTAPKGAVWSGSTLFAIPLSILRKNYIKSKIQAKKLCKVFGIFDISTLPLAGNVYLHLYSLAFMDHPGTHSTMHSSR